MKMDLIDYLERNLRPDPEMDITEGVIAYVKELQKAAKSLDKIRAAQKKYESSEKGKKYRKRYYKKHKAEYILRSKKWYAENPEKVAEMYERTKEHRAEYNRQWRLAHPNYMKEYYRKKKAEAKRGRK